MDEHSPSKGDTSRRILAATLPLLLRPITREVKQRTKHEHPHYTQVDDILRLRNRQSSGYVFVFFKQGCRLHVPAVIRPLLSALVFPWYESSINVDYTGREAQPVVSTRYVRMSRIMARALTLAVISAAAQQVRRRDS